VAAELIIYGIVAAGLVLWLRNILGTRHGEERQRPNPYLSGMEPAEAKADDDNVVKGPGWTGTPEEQISKLFEDDKNNLSLADETARRGLLDIAEADRSFDAKKFMEAVQDVFVYVVESFADGDRETLQDLLSDDVYKAFDAAIAEREKAGQRMEAEILAFRVVEIIKAELQGKKASIMIRFHAEEISVTYDKDDKVIAGHPERVSEMHDLWVFSRDIASNDPRWIVTETRDDVEGDNDKLPNA